MVLTLEELKHKGCIYINRIEEGFGDYDFTILEGSPEELREYVESLIEENGWENAYADFYYGTLSAGEKEAVKAVLSKEQKDWIEAMDTLEKGIYFPLERELFEIIFFLSVTETLFSTFYFSKYPCTVWSSYDHKFVVFTKRKTG